MLVYRGCLVAPTKKYRSRETLLRFPLGWLLCGCCVARLYSAWSIWEDATRGFSCRGNSFEWSNIAKMQPVMLGMIMPTLYFGYNNRDNCPSKSQFSKDTFQHLHIHILIANSSRRLKQIDIVGLRIVHLRATLYSSFNPSTTSPKNLDQYYSWLHRLQQIQDSRGLSMYTWKYQPSQDVQHCYTRCSKLYAQHSRENVSSENTWRWLHI